MTREDKNRYINNYIHEYMNKNLSTYFPKYDDLGEWRDFYDAIYDDIYIAISSNRFETRSTIISAVYVVWVKAHISDGWVVGNFRNFDEKMCFTLVKPRGSSTRIKKFYTSVTDLAYQYAHKTHPKRDRNR